MFGNPFPVDIRKSMTVGHLKEMIKNKKENVFWCHRRRHPRALEGERNVPCAGRLHLIFRKLSPPIPSAEIDAKLRDVQSPQQIPGCVKLKAMDELSEHFSSAHRHHLRIIVEAPPTRKYFRDLFIFTLILILSLSCH